MNNKTYFISGIDTDAGKSFCTGWLALRFAKEGKRVVTQKFVQTGNCEFSEDIELHRRIMGCGMLPEDLDHTTAPLVFSYPCSPQLAAKLDKREIDLGRIAAATDRLESLYDVVLIEGAGGLLVPLRDDYLTIDYPVEHSLPVVLVVHGALGSINHALLSMEAIKSRGLDLPYVLYNTYFDNDSLIASDTRGFLQRYVSRNFPKTEILDVPRIFLPAATSSRGLSDQEARLRYE